MKNFDKEINNFLLTGTFENNLDDASNINLSTDPMDVNQQYIAYFLTNNLYKNDQIESLYDVNIVEFSIPTTTKIESGTNTTQLIQENIILQNQLNTLISSSNQNSSSAIAEASKDIIINLRIQMGQGTSVEDFSSNFPYLKK